MRNQWSYILISFAGLSILILGCEKQEEQVDTTTGLSGIWIEQINGNDTIDFKYFDSDTNMLILRRGFELRNDLWLPKYNSGPYLYTFKDDNIMLYYMASSVWGFNPYYFEINSSKDLIEIGNFYDTLLSSDQYITFCKVQ